MLCVKVLRRPVWSRRKDTTPCTPFEGLLAPESAGNASSTRRLEDLFRLDRVLGFSTGGTGVGRVGMAHELDGLLVCDLEDLLEAVADLHENSLRLLRGALRLASLGGVGLCAGAAGPETNTVEGLANVDDDTHDLVVVIILELLANGAEQDMQPDVVVGLTLLEGVGPATTVLVLRIFPLRADTVLEEVVVGLGGELGGGGDVVLECGQRLFCPDGPKTAAYVDTPELFNTVETNDLLQQLVPVLLLSVSGRASLRSVIAGQVPFRLEAW
jgi:hypothetical protein